MPTVREADSTWAATCPQVAVTSAGGAHELTKMAAIDPDA